MAAPLPLPKRGSISEASRAWREGGGGYVDPWTAPCILDLFIVYYIDGCLFEHPFRHASPAPVQAMCTNTHKPCSVQYTVYSTYSTVYSAQCTVHSSQYTFHYVLMAPHWTVTTTNTNTVYSATAYCARFVGEDRARSPLPTQSTHVLGAAIAQSQQTYSCRLCAKLGYRVCTTGCYRPNYG